METFVKNIMTAVFAVVVIGGGFYNLGYYQARADAQKISNVNSDTSQDVEENYIPDSSNKDRSRKLNLSDTVPPDEKDFFRLTIWKKVLLENSKGETTDEIIDEIYTDFFIIFDSENYAYSRYYINRFLSKFDKEGMHTAVVTRTQGGQLVETQSFVLDEPKYHHL